MAKEPGLDVSTRATACAQARPRCARDGGEWHRTNGDAGVSILPMAYALVLVYTVK